MADSGAGPSRNGLPSELKGLVRAESPRERSEAWRRFLDRYNRLLLHTVHLQADRYDGAMDRYAYVLERFRDDDFRRLRAYRPGGSASFTTWLVVVTRRLCIDFVRERYGRVRTREDESEERARQRHATRKRLTDLVAEELDPERLAGDDGRRLESRIAAEETTEVLGEVLAGLPGRDRLLLALRFEHDLTAREIAGIMDFPSQFHVYRRLRKVLGELRTRLRERGVSGPHG